MQYYSSFVVMDFETGGLPNGKDKRAVHEIAVTEVSLCGLNEDLEITEQISYLIKPYKEGLIYDKEAEKASGISKQMCEESGEDINIVCQEMVSFFKRHKVKGKLPVVAGHNFIKFDSNFLINMFEFCKVDLFKLIQEEPEDSIKWSRLMWKESTNYKLGTVLELAGITLEDAHRAESDTLATTKLLQFFLKNLRGMGSIKEKQEVNSFRRTFEL